jgi:hypothetical protein
VIEIVEGSYFLYGKKEIRVKELNNPDFETICAVSI